METITIKLSENLASDLLTLLNESKDTGNKEWDANIDLIAKQVAKKLDNLWR